MKAKRRTRLALSRIQGSAIEVFWGLFSGLIALAYSFWAFKELPSRILDNEIPLAGDGALVGSLLQSVKTQSWHDVLTLDFISANMGWPGVTHWSRTPPGNLIEIVSFKFYSEFFPVALSGNIIHVFSITKSIVIAICSFILFRSAKISQPIAFFCAVVFSVGSFNLIRSEGHFLLGFTWSACLGMASLVLAFRATWEVQRNRLIIYSLVCGLPVGFSSFYYSILILIIGTLCFFFISVSILANRKSLHQTDEKIVLQGRRLFVCYLFFISGILVGLFYQLGNILNNIRNVPSLTSIGDRSPIEPIVYSGSLESLFFDSSKVLLSAVNRLDLVNFLGSRISWEGSQTSSYVGIFFYVAICTSIILMIGVSFNKKYSNVDATHLKFLLLTLVATIVLYLPSPINFAISRVFSQIRAWGRVSVFVTLLVLCIIGYVITNSQKILMFVILSLVLILNHADVTLFRNSRPSSSELNVSAKMDHELKQKSLDQMKKILKKGCAIAYLPTYPFPEFDYPADLGGDYEPLSIILNDYGYFRWSYGAIKNTQDFRVFQNSLSDQPNFTRMTIYNQVLLGREMGACAALVDFKMISEAERMPFRLAIESLPPKCRVFLDGDKILEAPRYLFMEFQSYECGKREAAAISETLRYLKASKGVFYRFNTPYANKFEDDWILYSKKDEIEISINNPNMNETKTLDFGIRLFDKEGNRVRSNIEVCLRLQGMLRKTCQSAKIDSMRDFYRGNLDFQLNPKSLSRVGLSINSLGESVSFWSVKPIFD